MTYVKGWGANKTTREYLDEFDAYSGRAKWINANSLFEHNLTPEKQKANELFIKYRILATDDTIEKRERTAKKSVLICIEEILYIQDLTWEQINFWVKVKEELNNIKEI